MKQLLKSATFAAGLALAMIAVLPKPAVAAVKVAVNPPECEDLFLDQALLQAAADMWCTPGLNYNGDFCAMAIMGLDANTEALREANCWTLESLE